jgi:hypothetical protein
VTAPSFNVAIAEALEAQARALTATAAALRESAGPSSAPRFYNQSTSPLSKRVYLSHAKKGDFPTRVVGKLVLVEREAFDTWLAKQPPAQRRSKAAERPARPRSADDQALADLGLRRKGAA